MYLKNEGLLFAPLSIFAPEYIQQNPHWPLYRRFFFEVFRARRCICSQHANQNLLPIGFSHLVQFNQGFYKYQKDRYNKILRNFRLQENVVYQDTSVNNPPVEQFLQFIRASLEIQDTPIENHIVWLSRKKVDHHILNEDAIIARLKQDGYSVRKIEYYEMQIADQVREMARAEYVISAYGSNMANAMFLDKNAKVILIWPKYAKLTCSRKKCMIHESFLSRGVTLAEYDKPYHESDTYYLGEVNSEYFYVDRNVLKVRKKYINLDELDNIPFKDIKRLREVNMYIDEDHFMSFFNATVAQLAAST